MIHKARRDKTFVSMIIVCLFRGKTYGLIFVNFFSHFTAMKEWIWIITVLQCCLITEMLFVLSHKLMTWLCWCCFKGCYCRRANTVSVDFILNMKPALKAARTLELTWSVLILFCRLLLQWNRNSGPDHLPQGTLLPSGEWVPYPLPTRHTAQHWRTLRGRALWPLWRRVRLRLCGHCHPHHPLCPRLLLQRRHQHQHAGRSAVSWGLLLPWRDSRLHPEPLWERDVWQLLRHVWHLRLHPLWPRQSLHRHGADRTQRHLQSWLFLQRRRLLWYAQWWRHHRGFVHNWFILSWRNRGAYPVSTRVLFQHNATVIMLWLSSWILLCGWRECTEVSTGSILPWQQHCLSAHVSHWNLQPQLWWVCTVVRSAVPS